MSEAFKKREERGGEGGGENEWLHIKNLSLPNDTCVEFAIYENAILSTAFAMKIFAREAREKRTQYMERRRKHQEVSTPAL